MIGEGRKIVMTLHNEDKSLKYIAYTTGRQRSIVLCIIKRCKNENEFENKHRSGRPSK